MPWYYQALQKLKITLIFVRNKRPIWGLILFIFVVISILVLSLKFTKAQTSEIHLDDSITKPYFLNQANTTYILDTDITADGSALVVDGDNITLDLNNHTVTFGNVNVTGIPNDEFENGNGEVPDNWDLSGAPSAKRTSTSEMPLGGDWLLKFDHPTSTEQVVSDWVNLPQANRTYMAVVTVKSCWGCMHHLQVEDGSGNLVKESSSDNVERAPMLSVQFKPEAAGNYRLRIIFENPGGSNSFIDHADIRPAYDSGILMRSYFDVYRTPDLTDYPNTGNHQNFVIKNGRIVEGSGKGIIYRAIHKGGSGAMEIDNVYSEVSGVDGSNFWIESGGNTDFHDSTLVNRSPYVRGRMSLDNFPVVSGSNMRFYNNLIDGGQGGISTSGGSNVEIYNNTIKINANVTNHFAVTTYNSDNIQVYNNRFEPYNGPGILYSSGTTNSEIHDNYFNITNFPCPAEYYTGLNTPIVRVTDYNGGGTQNNKVYNNLMIGTAKSFAKYPSCRPSIYAFNICTSGENNQYFNNDIKIELLDSKADAVAIASSGLTTGTFRNNRFQTNNLFGWFGNSNGSSGKGNFISNVFVKGDNPINFHSFRLGYCCSINADDFKYLDNRFINGAEFEDNIFGVGSGGGHYSYEAAWYLNVKVIDTQKAALANTSISVADKDGQEVFSGMTDVQGRINNIELKQFSREGTYVPTSSTYTDSAPHLVRISKSGYQTETRNITMDSSKEMTIILDGSTDNEPPIISNVIADVDQDQKTATISWQTDKDSDSKLEYGTDTSYGTTLTDTNLTSSHSINITNLIPATYHFRVTSKDSSGLENQGIDHSFFILSPGIQGIILTKSVDKPSANQGETLTYTLTYTNNLETEVTNAKIEDPIPVGTSYVSGSASDGGVLSGGKLIWNLGTLDSGGSGNVQFKVKIE